MRILKTYVLIFKNCPEKGILLKYWLKRLVGIKATFSKDLFLRYEGYLYNCGKQISSLTIPFYGEKLLKEMESNNGFRTFVDVGACLGTVSIPISKGFEKVISIEPVPMNIKLLKKNIELNSIKNIEVHEVTCTNEKKEVSFFINDLCPAGSSLKAKTENRILIKGDLLDNLLKNERGIDVIKIDVEGSELEVLEGSIKTIKKHKPIIYFESWDNKRLNEIKQFFDKSNYKVSFISGYDYLAVEVANE